MQREIYEVTAKIIDANGTFNTLSGYPKTFDSRNFDNDVTKAYNRACGEFHACLGTMYPRDDRKLQIAMIIQVSSGNQIEMGMVGKMPEDPDPNPVVEE